MVSARSCDVITSSDGKTIDVSDAVEDRVSSEDSYGTARVRHRMTRDSSSDDDGDKTTNGSGDSSSSTQSCKRARGHKSILRKYPTVDCRLCNKSVRNINSSLRHHSASHLSSTQSTTDNSREHMKNMENRCFGVDIVMIGKGYRHKSMHHQTHIECRECHQLLSNIHMSLYRHAASHLHLAFYSCRLCPYKSKSWPPSNIKRHLREHHKSMGAVEYADDRNECKTAVQNAMRNCFDYDYGRM